MKVLSLALLLFLCSIATLYFGILADAKIDPGDGGTFLLNEGQLAEMELRRQANQFSELDCEQVVVLFTRANIEAGQTSEVTGPPKTFDRIGGTILLEDPKGDDNTTIADYSYLITFLDGIGGCIANGAYTFTGGGDQVTFTASCSGLPFFSITGGRGKYSGAEGFVEFMIPLGDGFIHKINICSFSNSDKKGWKNKTGKKEKKYLKN